LPSKSGSRYVDGEVHALAPQRGYMRSLCESIVTVGNAPVAGSKQRFVGVDAPGSRTGVHGVPERHVG
jgi:hypothetical protein